MRDQPLLYKLLAAACGIVLAASAAAQPSVEQIENAGIERTAERREAQGTVDSISEASRKLLDAYREEMKIVRGLEDYIDMLNDQLNSQLEEISALQTSITDVAVIERQILPLMARMLDGLAQFINLDVPFLLDERRDRVIKLNALLRRSDVTVAEKSRRVFEAFEIENDFGRTIESYRGKLALNGGSFDADFLRIGRVGLLYRTVGDNSLGYWNRTAGRWDPLPSTPYRRLIDKGLRVAAQEIAPEMVNIPINPAEVGAL